MTKLEIQLGKTAMKYLEAKAKERGTTVTEEAEMLIHLEVNKSATRATLEAYRSGLEPVAKRGVRRSKLGGL